MTRELDVVTSLDRFERLAETLFRLAGDENVRAIEALAAALTNRQNGDGDAVAEAVGDVAEAAPRGLQEASTPFAEGAAERLQLCRRIARRALRGSLADPTRGATAFHRIETTPAWSRHHLPIAVVGPFLFYRIDSESLLPEAPSRPRPRRPTSASPCAATGSAIISSSGWCGTGGCVAPMSAVGISFSSG